MRLRFKATGALLIYSSVDGQGVPLSFRDGEEGDVEERKAEQMRVDFPQNFEIVRVIVPVTKALVEPPLDKMIRAPDIAKEITDLFRRPRGRPPKVR